MAIQTETINSNTINHLSPSRVTTKAATDAKDSGVNKASLQEDSVIITSAAKDLQNTSVTDNKPSAIDENRINEIKTAIENGNYQVNPERTATKMLSLETQLPYP